MAGVPSGGNHRLADIFSELLILATHLRSAKDYGTPDGLRKRIVDMFENADRKGKNLGFSADVLHQARYAVTAFLDEMILTSPLVHREQWSANPLQYEFFKENVAGVEFFNRLDAIRRELPPNTDLLEVYYLCLALGFEGRYKIHDRDHLRTLVDKLAEEIQARRGATPSLSPHAARPDELMEVVKRELPVWVVVTTSLAIIFFFYLTVSFLVGHDANQVAREITQFLELNP